MIFITEMQNVGPLLGITGKRSKRRLFHVPPCFPCYRCHLLFKLSTLMAEAVSRLHIKTDRTSQSPPQPTRYMYSSTCGLLPPNTSLRALNVLNAWTFSVFPPSSVGVQGGVRSGCFLQPRKLNSINTFFKKMIPCEYEDREREMLSLLEGI